MSFCIFTGTSQSEFSEITLIKSIEGKLVEVLDPDASRWKITQAGSLLKSNSWLRTGEQSIVKLVYLDGKTKLALGPNSEISLSTETGEANSAKFLQLKQGTFLIEFISNSENPVTIHTPGNIIKGVKARILTNISKDDNSMRVMVIRGSIKCLDNQSGNWHKLSKGNVLKIAEQGSFEISEIDSNMKEYLKQTLLALGWFSPKKLDIKK